MPLSVGGTFTSVTTKTSPSHGTTTSPGKTITYTPTTGYTGADSFTYTASNGSTVSATAGVVQIAVAPLAGAVATTVAGNSMANIVPPSVTGAYDTIAIATFPTHGSAAASGSTMTYTPAVNYAGSDTFQYVAGAAVSTTPALEANSPPATVTVTVNPPPPIANPSSFSVPANTTSDPVPLNITGGAPTGVTVTTLPTHGATSVVSLTSITYTPTSGYSDPDSFQYTAKNTGGTSPPATVSVTVTPLTAIATYPANCPTTAPSYACGSAKTGSNTFTTIPATATVTGGSGSYTYAWTAVGDGLGAWTTGQTTQMIAPAVSGVKAASSSSVTYTCVATDTVSHKAVTSNPVYYQWTNTNGQ